MPKTISFAGLSASGADGPPAGALPPGIGVGRYEIARLLRHDAYALTYAATDAQDGSDVVIREYLPLQLAARDGARTVLPRSAEAADHFQWGRERFVSEARRLASLGRTPGIVRVRGIVEAHGTVAMVMDPVPGETLEARLARDGRLPPAAVEQMLEVLLAGLSRAHANAVLHLDITPQAIVLDEDGRPTLIDFSRARLALAARLKSRLLRPGSAYAAPELSGDTRPGPQSDIYGLSATLYHCVAGRPPPPAAARRTMAPAAQAAAGHFTPALLAGIDAGLALKVEDRPPTVGAWRLRLMGDEEFPEEAEEEHAAAPSTTHRPFASAAAQLGSAKARLDATASSAASKARESRERLRRHTAARAASATSRFRRGRARLAALPAACGAGLRRAAAALPSPSSMMRAGRDGAARHRQWLPFAALALLLIAGAAAAWQVLRPGGIEPGGTIATVPPAPGDEAARRDAEAKRIAQQQEEAARREAEEKAAAEQAARREAEAKRAAEQEAARREAEAKRAAEQEAARREAEAKRAAEQEAARREAEEKARAEAARQQREADAKRARDETARRAAEEKARAAATVQRRHEAEARARAAALRAQEAATSAKEAQGQTEAARQQREAQAKRAQEEAARRAAEEKARAEAARQQREAEAKRAQEEAARRKAEEQARAEAARQQREAEAKRAQEEAARRAAEEKRAQEEAARREAQAKEKAQEKAQAERFAEILDRLESEAAIPAEPQPAKPPAPADPKQAEAAERALGLSPRDRARVQIALSSLGFDTKGVDEVFGPRTRQMIAAWQKKQGAPDTGFLTRQQFATLERTAEEALGRYDAEKRRFEEMMRGATPPQARRQRPTPARPARWTPRGR